MLAGLRVQGISMLVSTPYMDEAGRCDRVALINGGKILEIDTPQRIVEGFGEPLYALSGADMFGVLGAARHCHGVRTCYPFGEVHHLVTTQDFDRAAFVAQLSAEGFRDVKVTPVSAGIEDVFIKRMENE